MQFFQKCQWQKISINMYDVFHFQTISQYCKIISHSVRKCSQNVLVWVEVILCCLLSQLCVWGSRNSLLSTCLDDVLTETCSSVYRYVPSVQNRKIDLCFEYSSAPDVSQGMTEVKQSVEWKKSIIWIEYKICLYCKTKHDKEPKCMGGCLIKMSPRLIEVVWGQHKMYCINYTIRLGKRKLNTFLLIKSSLNHLVSTVF